MERALKWLLPLLIVTNVALVGSGVLAAQTALLVGGAIELLALAVALRQVFVVVRRYRQDRSTGLDVETALEDGLATILPRPAARLVALEPRIWISIFKLLFRRKPLAANEFSYSKRSIVGAFMVFMLLGSPAEIFVFELLIPWSIVRWLLLIASVYSVVWFFGYYASLKTMPYRIDAKGLHIFYGVTADGLIPLEQIEKATAQRRKTPKPEGAQYIAAENALYIACGSRTDVTLQLSQPVVIRGLLKPFPPVSTIYLAADQADKLTTGLQQPVLSKADMQTKQVFVFG